MHHAQLSYIEAVWRGRCFAISAVGDSVEEAKIKPTNDHRAERRPLE